MSYRRVYDEQTGQIISMPYDATNKAKYFNSGVSAGDYVAIKPDSLFLQINTETYD